MVGVPPASAGSVDIVVADEGDTYVVDVEGVAPGDVDAETAQLGFYMDVNRARGATPASVSRAGGTLTLEFDADDVSLGDEDTRRGDRVRFVAKRTHDRVPLRGTATVGDSDDNRGDGNGHGNGNSNGHGN